ncbi:MAG: ABC transporter permease [Bacteroidaceae bacterium]|nr:ABC transporter permease [Bacteroidaceae bacterium]
MITHYLKVAFRNLLKYKTQTVISVLGLAVGFVCFSLSALWIEHESTFDHYRQDVDRLYMVRSNDGDNEGGIKSRINYPFGKFLLETYPEVEEAAPFIISNERIEVNGMHEVIQFSSAEPEWMDMMDIRIVEGNRNFMNPQSNAEVAITRELAEKWFGTRSPLGKEIKTHRYTKTICAVVETDNSHTNFAFDMMGHPELGRDWYWNHWSLLIKVKPDTDIEALETKINANLPKEVNELNSVVRSGVNRIYLTPVSTLRSAKDYLDEKEAIITLDYIIYFSVAGVLIILCAIVNYLALFVNRMRVRQREMGLRMLVGANLRSLMTMLGTEFLMLLTCAWFVSCMMTELSIGKFTELASIDIPYSQIYGKSILSVCVISLIILIMSLTLLYFMHYRSMRLSIQHTNSRVKGAMIRKVSLVLQLFVCLSFITGTMLMNKQIDHLRTHDLGMEYENRAAFEQQGSTVDMSVWKEKIKRLPMVTEVLENYYHPMISKVMAWTQISEWDGNEHKLEYPISATTFLASEEFFKYYGITLIAGECLNDFSTKEDVIINESLARKLGWSAEEAIGKHFNHNVKYKIIGVVKDCHYGPPTSKMLNSAFIAEDYANMLFWSTSVFFKYKEGTWPQCKQALEEMCADLKATGEVFRIYNEEETYNAYLRAEDMLTRLLTFASVVCVFIAIFGIYSLVTLTCEQRRKEIAIRKVNGATVKDILFMFFREYLTMLVIASVLAFPTTYTIVKQWIQGYIRQMEISIWPFILVFLGLLAVVIISISWRVWKAANENPADVVKSE